MELVDGYGKKLEAVLAAKKGSSFRSIVSRFAICASRNDSPIFERDTEHNFGKLGWANKYLAAEVSEMSVSALIGKLDMAGCREHYLSREQAHINLRRFFAAGSVEDYVDLALGIANPAGNYSAAEHGLGPRILEESEYQRIFDLATEIDACPNTHHLPDLIYRHRLPYLKISVGSEIAMMLKPDVHWVGNVRTVWSHLLIKHKGMQSKANQELKLYRDGQRDSEMDYKIWRDIYIALEPNIVKLGGFAADAAASQGVSPGALRFMWPDAAASFLFDRFADRRHA